MIQHVRNLNKSKTLDLCAMLYLLVSRLEDSLTGSKGVIASNRPLSVHSQPGGQNKIVLHLKGLFLSGERTTIVLCSKLE